MDRELINIIPGARIVIVCLRTALIIIAVFIMATNCVVKETCAIKWLESVSTVCIMINLIYILSLIFSHNLRYEAEIIFESSTVIFSNLPLSILE